MENGATSSRKWERGPERDPWRGADLGQGDYQLSEAAAMCVWAVQVLLSVCVQRIQSQSSRVTEVQLCTTTQLFTTSPKTGIKNRDACYRTLASYIFNGVQKSDVILTVWESKCVNKQRFKIWIFFKVNCRFLRFYVISKSIKYANLWHWPCDLHCTQGHISLLSWSLSAAVIKTKRINQILRHSEIYVNFSVNLLKC